MDKPTVTERLRYWFDGVMSRGMIALIGLLALASVALVALMSLVVVVFGLGSSDGDNFAETFWKSLMHALDSGTLGGDEGNGLRAAQLVVTVGGIILVASLISIISGAFDRRVEELRKGRSRVLESDHTLILGWSSKIFPIVNELCIANESRGRAAIVVLANGDKVEMEDELRAKVAKPGKTRIIVRSGDPMDLTDLEVANPQGARSVIIIAPEDSDDPDSVVIKTALALTNDPRRKAGVKHHIVGEIQHPGNLEAARLVGRDEADWVLTDDLISRITVQTSRQSGLSVVYTELLDFDGDEIYFSEQPTLVGKSFFEAQLAFDSSTVIGVVTDGAVLLNPPADRVYARGDKLILIAEDDSTITLGTPGIADLSAVSTAQTPSPQPEQALMLGYNQSLHAMLVELNAYVAVGSTVTVVADVPEPSFGLFENLAVTFVPGDTTSRIVLEGLKVEQFEHIIVLADDDSKPHRADAKTLITLLHLRDMADKLGVDLSVVSEMLDDRNRELAEVTQADDFIVSDKLISLMLSQISENDQLSDVFQTLFSSEGSEIYLRDADRYVTPGTPVDFYTVLEAARRRGETAIGFRLVEHAHDKAHRYGVSVNPRKGEKRVFASGDKIIVLAED
jgi:voltage-gated potassium channel Kch